MIWAKDAVKAGMKREMVAQTMGMTINQLNVVLEEEMK